MTAARAFSLQLTEQCNLRCRYCYVLRRGAPDPLDCTPGFCEKFVDFTRHIARDGIKITFFGGEPLLRPDLIRHTVAYAKKSAGRNGAKPIRFHLVTNATLLEDAIGDFIAEEGIGLEVSIDGPASIHDQNRPFADGSPSFHSVYGNLLRFAQRHPRHPLFIFSVVSSRTVLPWLQNLCRGLEAKGLTCNPVRLFGPLRGGTDRHPNGDESAVRSNVDSPSNHLSNNVAEEAEANTARIVSFLENGTPHRCEAGINATITTRNGDIYPCPFFIGHPDQVIGHVAHGFYPDRVKPHLDRYQFAKRACGRCGARPSCTSGCSFEAYTRSGSVEIPSRASCARMRADVRRLRAATIRMAVRKPELLRKGLFDSFPAAPSPPRPECSSRSPRDFVIRLTGRCNLSCDYCYERASAASQDDLTQAGARKIIRHILASPVIDPLICLFGGEPLLNWPIGKYLIEEIARKGQRLGKRPRFHLTTNGSLLTPDIVQTIVRHDMTVQVSIDGPAELHDLHRKFPDARGCWESVRRGIELLQHADAGVTIDAQAVLTPGRIDMIAVARSLKAMGLRRISFLVCRETPNGPSWSDRDIYALMRARADFFPFFIESALREMADVDMGFAALVAAEPEGPAGICEGGAGEIYIDTRASIYRCPQLHAAGSPPIGEGGSPSQMGNTIPPEQRSAKPACRTCWAYHRCRGGCLVRNQQCPWVPAASPPNNQKLWCDYMRAEFSRAMLAYRILENRRPRSIRALKEIFGV